MMKTVTKLQLAGWLARICPVGRVRWWIVRLTGRWVTERVSFWVRSVDGRQFLYESDGENARRILFFGEVEPNVTRIFERLVEPSSIVIDVGANIGWYSTLADRILANSGSVHAIEAVPSTLESLRRNIERNRAESVVVHQVLCSDTSGEGEIYEYPSLHSGISSMKPLPTEAPSKRHMLRMCTLDDLIGDQATLISVIKIDVEGAECAVLKGARRLLGSGRVNALIVEANRERAAAFGSTVEECCKLLRESGAAYEAFRIVKGRRVRLLPMRTNSDFSDGENLLFIAGSSPAYQRIRLWIQ